ncbi:MAG: ComEA family DNA-binding protein [Acidimicrobiia bacterium]|nr:ComEA family DNA-binding protein [Acidimicrobiia bacterium]
MPDGYPSSPMLPPRPGLPDGRLADLGDRLRALRGDPRLGAVAVVAVALAAGAFWFRSATATPTGQGTSEQETAETTTSAVEVASASAPGPTTQTAPIAVVVHVAGAVRRPGVATLPTGSRVVDAIDAAGGGLRDADLDRLNLAAPLVDGEKVLVARVGDPPTPVSMTASGGSGTGTATEPSAPLDLNAATQAELEELPGIGPTLAAAIIDERDRRGGFTDVAQLQQVSGIGESRYAQIRDLVAV